MSAISRVMVRPAARIGDVVALCKPRLSLLVVCTAATGMWVAPIHHRWAQSLLVLVAIALVVGAANALNSLIERDIDALMHRTQNRPLPAGRLTPRVALLVALAMASVGTALLVWSANPLTATLSLVGLLVYTGLYTPLKKVSSWALPVGAISGALPPLLGWTAATGKIDSGGVALFAILFFWQLPHFIAISCYLRDDYARAGLRVFAIVYGERAARPSIAIGCGVLIPVTLSLVPLGLADLRFAAIAVVLGIGLWSYALMGLRAQPGPRWAARIFLGTIFYLTLLVAALITQSN